MLTVLEYLKSVGFWPWLILLVVLVIVAGDRTGVIKLPGGGEVNPGRQTSAETSAPTLKPSAASSSLDMRLARTDSDISWSLMVADDGRAIVPSSQARFRELINPGGERPRPITIVGISGHSVRRSIMVRNAVQETPEIGELGRPWRSEINPQSDGGLDYLELTPVSVQRGSFVVSGIGERTLHAQYSDVAGRVIQSFSISARFNPRLKLWEGHAAPLCCNAGRGVQRKSADFEATALAATAKFGALKGWWYRPNT